MSEDKDLIQKISEEIDCHFSSITIKELERHLIKAGMSAKQIDPVFYPVEYTHRKLTPKEFEKFYNKQLKPFLDSHAEEIDDLINCNPRMKQEVEQELREIDEAKEIPYAINIMRGAKRDLEPYDESKPHNFTYTHIKRGINSNEKRN